MKYILSPAGQKLLDRWAVSNVLLGFDFDGVLAPIVEEPDRATIPRQTRRLLAQLATLFPCIVISGRSRRDLLRRLHGIRLRGVIGNHGAEPGPVQGPLRQEVRRWRPILQERLSYLPGVRMEDKGLSYTVHYRKAPAKRAARNAILRAAAKLDCVRVIGGTRAVHILPRLAPHKGKAFQGELARLRYERGIYVGDDKSDEDVFALGREGRVLAIRVGQKPDSLASFYLRSQQEIDDLLRALREAAPSCLRREK